MKKVTSALCIMLSVSLFVVGGIIPFSDDDEHIDIINRNISIENRLA